MSANLDGIGGGIAQGAENFVKMRAYKEQKKRQDKLNKIQPVVEAIQNQLKDDTIPLDKRKELLDSLEHVYSSVGLNLGIPKGQSLSEILLPKGLLDQYIQTGETTTDEAVNAVPEGTSQTDNVTTSQVQIPLTKRRGEMSSDEIQMALRRMANKGQMSDELQRQEDYAKFQANLQDTIANKQYVRNPEVVVEPKTGRFWNIYTSPNPKFPVLYQPMGNYTDDRGQLITQPQENTIPKSTYDARQKAQGSNGLGATFNSLKFSVARELGLPETDPQVLDETAKRFAEQYSAKTQGLQYGALGGQQRTSGEVPIQPAQTQQFDFEKKKYLSGLQGQIDSADVEVQNQDEEINSIQSQIDDYKSQVKNLLSQGYEKEDKEVDAVQKNIDNLTRQQNAAKRRKAAAETMKTRAQKEYDSMSENAAPVSSPASGNKSKPKTSTTTEGGLATGAVEGVINANEQAVIKGFKAKNKKPPYNTWSDTQILTWARSKGYLK